MTAPTHETVLADIISSRGGSAAFSTESLAIASAVSHLLIGVADGDMVGASNITALLALLPPRRDGPPPQINMDLLSDREVSALQRLVEIGTGVKPRIEHKPKTQRYWDAIALADRLDEIVTDDRVGYCDAQLSAEDRVEIAGLIMALVSPLHIPVLFEETLRGAWDTQNWVPPSCIVAPENPAPAAVPRAAPALVVDNVRGPFGALAAATSFGGEVSPGCASGAEYTGDGGSGWRR
jgi:hypothetical protein